MRLYLPLVLLLFLGMLVFLPISAGWLANRAERELEERFGAQVELGRIEIVLAQAQVNAVSVSIPGGQDYPPFQIGHVAADGKLRGLLAGGEAWPDSVTVQSPSVIEVNKGSDGNYEFAGSMKSLLETIETVRSHTLAKRKAPDSAKGSPVALGRTPRVLIRNVRVEIEAPTEQLPPLILRINSIEIEERASVSYPVHARLLGAVTADTTEKFSLDLTYYPEEQRATLRGTLSQASLPFAIPGLGQFRGTTRNLYVNFEGRRRKEGLIEGALNIEAGGIEIRRDRVGGERWADSPFEMRFRVAYDPETNFLRVYEASLLSAQAEVAASGEVTLRDDLPGKINASVLRLPPAALALGRNELLERAGLRITAGTTSPTLRLDLSAEGALARPLQLDSEVSLRLGGWRFDMQTLPEPVDIEELEIFLSNELFRLDELALRIGGLELNASGSVPVSSPEKLQKGTLRLHATGEPETAFELLSRMDLVPKELLYFRVPLLLDASIAIVALQDPVNNAVIFSTLQEESRAEVVWREGEIGTRRLLSPLKLDPGRAVYENGALRLQRLRLSLGNITANVNGELRGGVLQTEPAALDFDGEINLNGGLPDFLQHLGHQVTLPTLPRDLAGQVEANLVVKGNSENPEILNYKLQLFVDEVSATLPTPYRPVPLTGASAEILVTPDTVQIDRLSVRVEDPEFGETTVRLSVGVTEERIRAEANFRTSLEFLSSVLAKDLADLSAHGVVPGEGWGEFYPTVPLPPGPDLPRRWLAYLAQPDLGVRFDDQEELRADFELTYNAETPVEITPREFPVRITNVRGNAAFRPDGIHVFAARGDFGTSTEVNIEEAHIELGRPVRITFKAEAGYFNLNEWLDGWGKRPWAAKPVSTVASWKKTPDPVTLLEIAGDIKFGKVLFLQFEGQKATGHLSYVNVSREPAHLSVTGLEAELYNGSGKGDIYFTFPSEGRPILKADLDIAHINLQTFMNALLERQQQMDGFLFATGSFEGQLLNYPTYTSDSVYRVDESSFGSKVVPRYAQGLVQLTAGTPGRDTFITGTSRVENRRAYFPDLIFNSPQIDVTADGFVDFSGNLNFDLTASVISRQIENIPVLSMFSDIVSVLGRSMVSYQLKGTVKDPKIETRATISRHLERLTEQAKKKEETRPKP